MPPTFPDWAIAPPATQDEIQDVALNGVPASGSFQLVVNGTPTALILWNDNAAAIQGKINAVYAPADAVVTGSLAAQLIHVDFGVESETNLVPLMTVPPGTNTMMTAGPAPIAFTVTISQSGQLPAIVPVDVTHQNQGWHFLEKPPFNMLNDWMNRVGQWIRLNAAVTPMPIPKQRRYFELLADNSPVAPGGVAVVGMNGFALTGAGSSYNGNNAASSGPSQMLGVDITAGHFARFGPAAPPLGIYALMDLFAHFFVPGGAIGPGGPPGTHGIDYNWFIGYASGNPNLDYTAVASPLNGLTGWGLAFFGNPITNNNEFAFVWNDGSAIGKIAYQGTQQPNGDYAIDIVYNAGTLTFSLFIGAAFAPGPTLTTAVQVPAATGALTLNPMFFLSQVTGVNAKELGLCSMYGDYNP